MKVLKGALLLLLLAVANAKPDHHQDHHHHHDHDHHHNHTDQKPADPDQCQVLQMLAEDNLQQVLGDWVLVWAVSDHQEGRDTLKNLSSSRVEMRLQADNQTLMFTKRNLFSDKKSINYYIDISMELLHNPNQTMHPIEGKMEVDGVFVPYNETGSVNFYETCPTCMMIVFKISNGGFLLNYRKEDHMKADHDTHRKKAECLGFDHDQPYIYDGVAGLAPVALYSSDDPETELRQGSCPSLWASFDGRCYKYIGTQTTWARAEIQCVSQEANLVSIHSQAEEDFVKTLIKSSDPAEGPTWIGLSDIHEQGSWMWSDGSAARFFFWNQGEPNNQGGEHCVHTNWSALKKWNDKKCSDTYPSVCASRTTCP